MNQNTIKLTLEGPPLLVDLAADRLKRFFTVTYESKDQHIKLTGHVRRYLRVVSPHVAHAAGDPAAADDPSGTGDPAERSSL